MSRVKSIENETVVTAIEPEDDIHANDPQFKRWLRLHEKLTRPFPVEEHRYRTIAETKNGAWIAYYVDLRSMMERLQTTIGFRFNIQVTPAGEDENGVNVKAHLFCAIGEDTYDALSVEDFGYAPKTVSEPLKSATTDALRRVLSHIGIGRYLYKLPRIFIRGERTENGMKFYANPLDVLRDVLENPPSAQVVFYPKRDEQEEVTKEKKEQKLPNGWAEMLDPSSPIGSFRQLFNTTRSTEKQIMAYMRLVKPNSTEVDALLHADDPDSEVKRVLDEKLGNQNMR